MTRRIIRRGNVSNNPGKEQKNSAPEIKAISKEVKQNALTKKRKPMKKGTKIPKTPPKPLNKNKKLLRDKKPEELTPEEKKEIETRNRFISSLKTYRGNISKACEATCVSRKWYYSRMNDDAEFVTEVYNAMEDLIDTVEGVVLELIEGRKAKVYDSKKQQVVDITLPPDGRLAVEWLKAKAKHRGWTTRHEITDANGNNIRSANISDEMSDSEATQLYLEAIK